MKQVSKTKRPKKPKRRLARWDEPINSYFIGANGQIIPIIGASKKDLLEFNLLLRGGITKMNLDIK